MIKNKKILILSIILFLLKSSAVFAQNLEVNYPTAAGTTPANGMSLVDYIKYIYQFVIVISGIIALVILIVAGIEFLISTGKPEKMKAARDRIVSAFWGIIILLGSYFILQTIRPGVIGAPLTPLPPVQTVSTPTPTPISDKLPARDPLTRITNLMNKTKTDFDALKQATDNIKTLTASTGKCDCKNTQPVCACVGPAGVLGINLKCQAQTPFSGDTFNPCGTDASKISDAQKKIVDQRDILLYDRNEALSEKDDLQIDVNNFLSQKIDWYGGAIESDQMVKDQLTDQAAKDAEQKIIDSLNEEQGWFMEERNYKNDLISQLNDLATAISPIETPATQLSQLPSKCFEDVKTKCTSTCKTGGLGPTGYGCHDAALGCQGDKVNGGNPCPTSGINSNASKISSATSITQDADKILSTISNITITKPRQNGL